MGHGRWVPTWAAERSPGRPRLADLQQLAVVIAESRAPPAVIDGRGEAGHAWWRPMEGRAPVILAVIPPGRTSKTRSHQMDGITELSCKNGITHYGVDAWEATHNRSVAGSRRPRLLRSFI
jgi:hypothetical protein